MSEPEETATFNVLDYVHPDDPPDDITLATQRAFAAADEWIRQHQTPWQRLKARASRLRRRG